jgi:hypothetical protein
MAEQNNALVALDEIQKELATITTVEEAKEPGQESYWRRWHPAKVRVPTRPELLSA